MMHYITTDKAQAAYVRLFAKFASTELDPKTYVQSLIPHNLTHARRVATRRGRGWRKEVRMSIDAVVAAKQLLRLMSVFLFTVTLTACDAITGRTVTGPSADVCHNWVQVIDTIPVRDVNNVIVAHNIVKSQRCRDLREAR